MHHLPDFMVYESEDFAADESFQGYVLYKRAGDVEFWENWIKQHPDKQHVIEESVELLLLLAPNKASKPEKQKQVELDRLLLSIRKPVPTPALPVWLEQEINTKMSN